MFLSFSEAFDTFKMAVLPFLSIFIPLVLSYWVAKKTNALVGILTIVLYCMLVTQFYSEIVSFSSNLGNILGTGIQGYLYPIIQMYNAFLELIGEIAGLSSTINSFDPWILCAIIWGIFLGIALLGNLFYPVKVISKVINGIFGITLLVVLFMAVFAKDTIGTEHIWINNIN